MVLRACFLASQQTGVILEGSQMIKPSQSRSSFFPLRLELTMVSPEMEKERDGVEQIQGLGQPIASRATSRPLP